MEWRLRPGFCMRGKIVAAFCIFSLIIVKSLQLRGRRQITELRKYCLVRIIVLFLLYVFSLFLFLTDWKFGLIPCNTL